ncbi:hypothetical protein [Zymomonas mobilis]|uniref:Uncharacterized protein n=1 Tax=Zymomonas mobilis subsp. pomaceae (strain ATCC 29192 / DSM 22645 / JCM 10191 / CCUG 17912 / NBRC 13757 / NCIMB 11200 / NRRL B-4491 / Barker I) TaxID=579138 RepID=F8EWK2_ZYMMT|nr:hypothetical protein [Zymomonas mobilis]AEI38645.1 hypothetical protein Zymop_2068 [Zymomonas mobilis subsp. pomaceae ATCC 29192]MDX5947801.1 hypothetical protein [Zymomonas mobilis subsp. pomaceae]GEB90064.1 hypothetical protein ZMO02_17010 [Zymomonas mobilis subsp. pomaceae]
MSKVIKEESAFKKISQGLEEAYAFAKGNTSTVRVRELEVLLTKVSYYQGEKEHF